MTFATADAFNWNNLVQLLTAALVAWTAWRVEQRAKTAKEERETLDQVKASVEIIHDTTNGLTQKLIGAEKSISKAEGKVEERQEVAERVIVAADAASALKDKENTP